MEGMRRHGMRDEAWRLLQPLPPGQRGQRGGTAGGGQGTGATEGVPAQDTPGRGCARHAAQRRRRGIATRYAKSTAPLVAAAQARCIVLWANLSAV